MLEITEDQILLDNFPVADVTWRRNASSTEKYLVIDDYDVQGAYDAGVEAGREEAEELGVQDNHDFADDKLSDLAVHIQTMTDKDVEDLIDPEQIDQPTVEAVLGAVLNMIQSMRDELDR